MMCLNSLLEILDLFLHDVSKVLLMSSLTLKEIGHIDIKNLALTFVPFPAFQQTSYENTLEFFYSPSHQFPKWTERGET